LSDYLYIYWMWRRNLYKRRLWKLY